MRRAALAVLTGIALDLAADASCDTVPSLGASLVTVMDVNDRGRTTETEACADVCVPDCFCCSRSVAADPAAVPPAPAGLTRLDPLAAGHSRVGHRPVVDHPPLLLS